MAERTGLPGLLPEHVRNEWVCQLRHAPRPCGRHRRHRGWAERAGRFSATKRAVATPHGPSDDGISSTTVSIRAVPDERRAATILFRALDGARASIERGERDALRLTAAMRDALRTERLAEADYVELVDTETLEPVTRLRGACLALLAVRIGDVRLIDNLLIEERERMFQTTL